MKRDVRRRLVFCSALLLVPVLAACDGLLDVDTSGILTPGDLDAAGPASVTPMIFGFIGNYHEAADDVARYASLITDEMISAGSFGGRQQVDARLIQPSNTVLTNAMYSPLHQARHLADTTELVLQERLQDPAYGSVVPDILSGIALSKLYGGYGEGVARGAVLLEHPHRGLSGVCRVTARRAHASGPWILARCRAAGDGGRPAAGAASGAGRSGACPPLAQGVRPGGGSGRRSAKGIPLPRRVLA